MTTYTVTIYRDKPFERIVRTKAESEHEAAMKVAKRLISASKTLFLRRYTTLEGPFSAYVRNRGQNAAYQVGPAIYVRQVA